MSELVQKLSQGQHKVEVSLRPQSTPTALRDAIGKGYVHLAFTETRGGTDLYVPLVPNQSDVAGGDFDRGRGTVKLVGQLTLDYIPVRCIASIDLETMRGTGHLEPLS